MTHPKYEYGKPILPALLQVLDVVEPTLTVAVKTAAEMFRLPASDLLAYVEKVSGQRLEDILAKYAQSTNTTLTRDNRGGFSFAAVPEFLTVNDLTNDGSLSIHIQHKNYGTRSQYDLALQYLAGLAQYVLVTVGHLPRGYAFDRDNVTTLEDKVNRGTIISWGGSYGSVEDTDEFTTLLTNMIVDGGSPVRRDGTRLITEPFDIKNNFTINVTLH